MSLLTITTTVLHHPVSQIEIHPRKNLQDMCVGLVTHCKQNLQGKVFGCLICCSIGTIDVLLDASLISLITDRRYVVFEHWL